MATVWQFLLHPSLGPVNAAIKWLGFEPVAFLSNPVLLIPTMALMGVWQILGFNMVLFLAGLTAISRICTKRYGSMARKTRSTGS